MPYDIAPIKSLQNGRRSPKIYRTSYFLLASFACASLPSSLECTAFLPAANWTDVNGFYVATPNGGLSWSISLLFYGLATMYGLAGFASTLDSFGMQMFGAGSSGTMSPRVQKTISSMTVLFPIPVMVCTALILGSVYGSRAANLVAPDLGGKETVRAFNSRVPGETCCQVEVFSF